MSELLDVFDGDARGVRQGLSQLEPAPRAPATWGELLGATWESTKAHFFFAEESAAGQKWSHALDQLRERTGQVLHNPMAYPEEPFGPGAPSARVYREQALQAIDEARKQWPDLPDPRTFDDAIRAERQGADRQLGKILDVASPLQRAGSWVAGGIMSQVDPVQLALLPFGAAKGAGLLRVIATEGAIGVLGQGVAEIREVQRYREDGVEDIGAQVMRDLGLAFVGGAVVGGGVHLAPRAIGAARRGASAAWETLDRYRGRRGGRLSPGEQGAFQQLAATAKHLDELDELTAAGVPAAQAARAHREALPEALRAVEAGRSPARRDDLMPAARGMPSGVAASAPNVAIFPDGRRVPVSYQVVDAGELVTSNQGDGSINAAYPADLQPRDRARAASTMQIRAMAKRLQPELLDVYADATTGPPLIVGDQVVLSGNGRVLAIRQAFADKTTGAAAYRSMIEARGFSTEGMAAPVLVRRLDGDLPTAELADLARTANSRTTASMGAAEQALADAQELDTGLLDLMKSNDVATRANGPFVRGFLSRMPETDRAGLMTADGKLSVVGVRRLKDALLARAYGDSDLVARLAEEQDTGLGPVGNALVQTAPRWARFRASVEAGAVSPTVDPTAYLLEAVRGLARVRDAGEPLEHAWTQRDMFGGALSPEAAAFAKDMVATRGDGALRLAGAQKIGERLGTYLDAADKVAPGVDIFGEPPAQVADVQRAVGYDVAREDPAPITTAEAERAEFERMLHDNAAPEEIGRLPMVQRAIAAQAAIPRTDLADGYGSASWWQTRRFAWPNETVIGLEEALTRFEREAGQWAGGDVAAERRAIIVLGPPAAGKSTIAEKLAAAGRAAIVDPDEIKKRLPEFAGGVGASAVHEESATIASEFLLDRMLDKGANLVLPKVGGKASSIEAVIGVLKDAGYRVDLVNMRVDPDEAFRRMWGRFLSTGRLIEPGYFRDVADKPTGTYIELKGKGAADGYTDLDNNQPFGSPPTVKEDAGGVGDLLAAAQRRGAGSDAGSGSGVGPSDRAAAPEAPGAGQTQRLGDFADTVVDLAEVASSRLRKIAETQADQVHAADAAAAVARRPDVQAARPDTEILAELEAVLSDVRQQLDAEDFMVDAGDGQISARELMMQADEFAKHATEAQACLLGSAAGGAA